MNVLNRAFRRNAKSTAIFSRPPLQLYSMRTLSNLHRAFRGIAKSVATFSRPPLQLYSMRALSNFSDYSPEDFNFTLFRAVRTGDFDDTNVTTSWLLSTGFSTDIRDEVINRKCHVHTTTYTTPFPLIIGQQHTAHDCSSRWEYCDHGDSTDGRSRSKCTE